jgi:hypothetical protein
MAQRRVGKPFEDAFYGIQSLTRLILRDVYPTKLGQNSLFYLIGHSDLEILTLLDKRVVGYILTYRFFHPPSKGPADQRQCLIKLLGPLSYLFSPTLAVFHATQP